MKPYRTLQIEHKNKIATIWLNRPDVRNALNGDMIHELINAFNTLGNDERTRVIILQGRGKAFCAGADLNWMRAAASNTYQQNVEESMQLALCFQTIYDCPLPTIAMVHGAAMGGANGLLAACDFAFCTRDTTFSLSEVKLGLVPGTISPYIIKRIGEFAAKDIMLTGRRFTGAEAAALRLVNASAEEKELEGLVKSTIDQLLTSAPGAVKSCKQLIKTIASEVVVKELMNYTATSIADARKSAEGQEGMSAFLEKRKPNWITE